MRSMLKLANLVKVPINLALNIRDGRYQPPISFEPSPPRRRRCAERTLETRHSAVQETVIKRACVGFPAPARRGGGTGPGSGTLCHLQFTESP
jgi:hypothetical protein